MSRRAFGLAPSGGPAVFTGWWLLLVALAYLGLLFGVAWLGDRRPLYPTYGWLRPIVYSLALAVYCTSWTFYGAVGSAVSGGYSYLPIYLGPALLFIVFGASFRRLVTVAQSRNVTSIADFIASRYGKSQPLAILVTLIALTAAVPYLALQFKAVAMGIDVLTGTVGRQSGPWLGDTAFYVAMLLALFGIAFGTRAIDATEHHHGLMLAIALESIVKLVAFLAVGFWALGLLKQPAALAAPHAALPLAPGSISILGFVTQTLLAFAAAVCLPRQFQVGVVECENVRDVRWARWAFPLYLAAFSALVVPIALAGVRSAPPLGVHPDSFVLWLPLSRGANGLALLAFLGGFSAATGMVIVASVALATMVSNELVMPALSRLALVGARSGGDLSRFVLWVRRATILMLAILAFGYYRLSADFPNLASVGLLAFTAVAQFAPAIVAGLYFRGASRTGATVGLAAGYLVWIYTMFLPTLAGAGWLPSDWLSLGPAGIAWLRPHALLGFDGMDPTTHGALWSLGANIALFALVSVRWRASVEERRRARAFLAVEDTRPSVAAAALSGRVLVGDLLELVARVVGEDVAQRALEEYSAQTGRRLTPEAVADRGLILQLERLLAAALGATSARLVLTSALRGTGMELDEVAALLDETSQELRFNRGLLQTTMENVAQGISVIDAELRLVAWNRRYLELFPYPDGMVYVGCRVDDLIRYNAERGEWGPGDTEEHVGKRLGHLKRGTPYVFQRVRPNGTVVEMRGQPMPGGGFVTTYADVTEYKRAEHELRAATEQLEQRVAERTHALQQALDAQRSAKLEAEAANLSKTRFLAAASHDLLQPLNAARLFTSALRTQPALDPEAAQLAERVDTALRGAEELLDGLLDISRLDAGALRAELEEFPLGELFETLQEQFRPLAHARGLEFTVMPTAAWVRSDRRLLRRVLQNLVSNALRYTHSGGVLLGPRWHRGQLEIQVLDTGPGIAVQHQRAIFEEFQRLDHPSPWGEKGLGLGLSICERMARLLGHPLSLRSTPGRGSCFGVRVPRVAVQATRPPRAALAGAPSLAADLGAMRVLCLDNDHSILDGMRALLERWGLTVDMAASVDEAERTLTLNMPDVILADYHLHDRMEGLDALDHLRALANGCSPSGALITADGSDALADDARRRGYALLRKPLKPAALRALLASFAQKRSVDAEVL
jgi:Na+/proline symporter/signal transduction histidine kinase/ActR/RegA family two-component response regulator